MAFGRALGSAMGGAGKAMMPGGNKGGAMSAIKQKIGLGPQPMQGQVRGSMPVQGQPAMNNAMQGMAGAVQRFAPPGGMQRPMPMPPPDEMMQAQGPPMQAPPMQAMGSEMGMRRPMPVPMGPQGPDPNDPMQQQKMQQMMAQRRGLGPSMRPQY